MPYLTRYDSANGPRWTLDGSRLSDDFTLSGLLRLPAAEMPGSLRAKAGTGAAAGALLAPIEPGGEGWAAGVTYLRSREAREAESTVKDVYSKVYDAARRPSRTTSRWSPAIASASPSAG